MNNSTKLQAQVKKLQREKALLRLFLHELVEAHYRVINQALAEPEAQEPEQEPTEQKPAKDQEEKESKKIHEIHNSSDLLDQMTEEDISNLKHGTQGESGCGDGVEGYCMWCGGEFTNLAQTAQAQRKDLEQKLKQAQEQLNRPTQTKETQIDSTSPEIANLKKQLALAQKQEQELNQEKTELSQQLTKVNKSLEFWKAEHQKALKNKPKEEPEPDKSPATQPINPWLLGTILLAGISLLWMLNQKGEKSHA